MLNQEGKENGIISRTSAIPKPGMSFRDFVNCKSTNDRNGQNHYSTVKLIWSRFIITTSFQIANNLFQLLDLFLR